MKTLTLIALLFLAGCSSTRDSWQRWRMENPAQQYDFDSATGRWERAK